MPLVLVELLQGRTDDQLREFTRVVTDAVVDILNATPASVVVRFSEYPASRMGSGGVLAADRVFPEPAGGTAQGAPGSSAVSTEIALDPVAPEH